MSRNQIAVAASPTAVFDVLGDAEAYPRWVVGARRMRRVDSDWPAEGSEFHHAVGLPGAELHDSTEVVEHVPLHRIVLEVRFRPTGTAVELVVDQTDEGSIVTMAESPDSGPVSWLPWFVTDPVLHAVERVVVTTATTRGRATSDSFAGPPRRASWWIVSTGQVIARAVERLGVDERLDELADPAADAVRDTLDRQPLKDVLSGTWLGHPLHPLLTDLPIGFWTSAFTLDLVGGRGHASGRHPTGRVGRGQRGAHRARRGGRLG